MSDDTLEDDPELKMYTTEQVAGLFEVSSQTVRNWISVGELPAVKMGNKLRIKRKDLLEFVNKKYGYINE